MRYLVARGANSQPVSTILASWQENLTVRDPSRARTKSLISIPIIVLTWIKAKKKAFHHENKRPSEPSVGKRSVGRPL